MAAKKNDINTRPLVHIHFELLNMASEIVDLPMKKMVMFHCYVNVHPRVVLENGFLQGEFEALSLENKLFVSAG